MPTVSNTVTSTANNRIVLDNQNDVSPQQSAASLPLLNNIRYLSYQPAELKVSPDNNNVSTTADESTRPFYERIASICCNRNLQSSRVPPLEPPLEPPVVYHDKSDHFATPLLQTTPIEPPIDSLDKKSVRFATPLVQAMPTPPQDEDTVGH